MAASFVFERFRLDTAERRLTADDRLVELNGRYFDALTLLVREQGKLVLKERFLGEVWQGVPVTDEALTQCIKTLRRQLGDDAARPRFIETVPKHGYRFIAPVEVAEPDARVRSGFGTWPEFVRIGSAGTLGGAIAGFLGGLIYGFAGASQADQTGAISTLLVLVAISVVVATIGAAGVSFAIATSELARSRSLQWLTTAGALGGLVTGAVVKLLGTDAFTLLIGRAPRGITGAMEGLLLGAIVGSTAWLVRPLRLKRQAALIGAVSGAVAGVVIVLLRGHLLLGSLATLTRDFPDSHLSLIRFFGGPPFSPTAEIITAALEGGLFVAGVVTVMEIARRRSADA